ncbi:hypothetical protein MIR68_004457 [Amoeboaphelidium protococcarum]|nr:hypothetical protein MIR68_004457 [Amoeboaphelidium protococcarum]
MKVLTSIALLMVARVVSAGYVCTNQTITVTNTTAKADFLFLLDASGSMCDKIAGVKAGVQNFVQKIDQSQIDARYALVVFGGKPEIRVPLTSDYNQLTNGLTAIQCTQGGQEASFEAMRMALTNQGADMDKKCGSAFSSSECNLSWRQGATKVFLHATDEDSDMPVNPKYRVVGQNSSASFCTHVYTDQGACALGAGAQYEPSFYPSGLKTYVQQDSQGKWETSNYFRNMYRQGDNMYLGQSFEKEIEVTAKMLNDNGVIVNSLVSLIPGTEQWNSIISSKLPISAFTPSGNYYFPKSGANSDTLTAALYQFGGPYEQVQDPSTFQNFDAAKTLNILKIKGMGNSLQARLLTKGNFMRVFDIMKFVNGEQMNIINAFFDQMVRTTSYVQNNCVFVPDPVTSTSTTTTKRTTTTTSTSKAATTSAISTLASNGTSVLQTTTTVQLATTSTTTASLTVVTSTTPTEGIRDDLVPPIDLKPIEQDDQSGSADPTTPEDNINWPPPKSTVIVVRPTNDSMSTGDNSSSTNTVVMIMAPVAAVAAAFGLFMLRRSRAVARDIKYAFPGDNQTAGENPLYAARFQSADNPLYMSQSDVNQQYHSGDSLNV